MIKLANGETLVLRSDDKSRNHNDVVVLEAKASRARVVYHEIQRTEYKIWWMHLVLDEGTTVLLDEPDKSIIGLYYTFNGDIHYNIRGLHSGMTKKDHFNLIFLPYIHSEYTLQKGDTTQFCIEFSYSFLEKQYSARHSDLLKRIQEKNAGMMHDRHMPITKRIAALIVEIEGYALRHAVRDGFNLDARVGLLTDLSLRQNSFELISSFISMGDCGDAIIVKKVINHIIEFPGSDLRLSTLEKLYGMNRITLRKGIKDLCGMLPSEVITRARLQAGINLLMIGKVSLKEIARITGFDNAANFSKAFKKQFGVTPAKFKDSANPD